MVSRKLKVLVTAASLGIVGLLWTSSYAQDQSNEPWTAPARAAKKKNPVAADDASIAAGKALYLQECRACHGDTGKGDGPSAKDLGKPVGDLSNPKVWDQTDGALFWKVTEGRKPMPSYDQKFSEEQRWQVINYIRTLAPKPQGK